MSVFFITGFPGAGKSTFAKMVGKVLTNAKIIDLDEYLEKKLSPKSLSEFVLENGWEKFRAIESTSLLDICSEAKNKDYFISLGGGALTQRVIDFANLNKIQLIWIDAPLELCLRRIESSWNINRPKPAQTYEEWVELYKKRTALNAKCQWRFDGSKEISLPQVVDFLSCIGQRVIIN